jgi:hypothetical protein
LFDVLRPLFDLSRDVRRIASNTLTSAAEVARTAPRRLEGVPFEAGERGRASSVVQQLTGQAAQLRQRGIDPELVPNASASVRNAISEAESLAAEEREAIIRITPVVAFMRQRIITQIRNATAVVRAALTRFLQPLETLLEFLARTLGSRLPSFILVPKFIVDEMLEFATGKPRPGGGA